MWKEKRNKKKLIATFGGKAKKNGSSSTTGGKKKPKTKKLGKPRSGEQWKNVILEAFRFLEVFRQRLLKTRFFSKVPVCLKLFSAKASKQHIENSLNKTKKPPDKTSKKNVPEVFFYFVFS